MGRNPAGIFDVEKCEQRTVTLPTLDSAGALPGHSSAIPVAILHILYFNARVPHLEPDFRLVLFSFRIPPIVPPCGEAYHIAPTKCTIVVAGAISLAETAGVYQAGEGISSERTDRPQYG